MNGVKNMKGMSPMDDVGAKGLKKPWWRTWLVILTCWLPLGLLIFGGGYLCWWSWNEVRLWEQTRVKWEGKGYSLDVGDFRSPEAEFGDSVLDDEWFAEIAGEPVYTGVIKPDLTTELYGEVAGPPMDTPSWFVLGWGHPDPENGLTVYIARDEEGGEMTNAEAARRILQSMEGKSAENSRLDELMKRPLLERRSNYSDELIWSNCAGHAYSLVEFYYHKTAILAAVGDTDGAVQASRNLHKALSWTMTEKSMLGWLNAIRGSRSYLNAVWSLVVSTDLTNEQLMLLQDDLNDRIDWAGAAPEIIKGENAGSLAVLDFYAETAKSAWSETYGKSPAWKIWLLRSAVRNPGFIARNKRIKTEINLRAVDDFETSGASELSDMTDCLVASYAKSFPAGRAGPMECFVDPDASWTVSYMDVRGEIVRWELARMTVAIARYRLEHGGDPAKLADLVPEFLDEVPNDPFDGFRLKMTRDDAGRLLVYSSGPDGVDDGGKLPSDVRWMMEAVGIVEIEE